MRFWLRGWSFKTQLWAPTLYGGLAASPHRCHLVHVGEAWGSASRFPLLHRRRPRHPAAVHERVLPAGLPGLGAKPGFPITEPLLCPRPSPVTCLRTSLSCCMFLPTHRLHPFPPETSIVSYLSQGRRYLVGTLWVSTTSMPRRSRSSDAIRASRKACPKHCKRTSQKHVDS